MSSKYVNFYYVNFGCDPEFFFAKNNEICGSEKILPKGGLDNGGYGKVIIDGVQAELNPSPNICRESLASNIKNCFYSVNKELDLTKTKIVFDEVVVISKKEMDSLSKESKTFGCAPSLNLYDGEESKIKVNPEIYKYRSAGGHIHLGFYPEVRYGSGRFSAYCFAKSFNINGKKIKGLSIHDLNDFDKIKDDLDKLYYEMYKQNPISESKLVINNDVKVFQEYEKLIYLLDIIVGNTSVLLDRNPLSAERRKVYGRAGEFRLTNYGVEYRVLSNFWLKSYTIFSLMFALARFAVCLLIQDKINGDDAFYDSIIKAVNPDLIEKAINENDFDLAMKNYLKIEKLVCKMVDLNDYCFPINNRYTNCFLQLVEKGIPHYFKKDILTHWIYLNEGEENRRMGWESFAEKLFLGQIK